MKLTKEHYEMIKKSILPFKDKLESHRMAIIAEGKAQDVDKRLRWDALRAGGLLPWICDIVYQYANDDHIDTALRQVMKDLGRLNQAQQPKE